MGSFLLRCARLLSTQETLLVFLGPRSHNLGNSPHCRVYASTWERLYHPPPPFEQRILPPQRCEAHDKLLQATRDHTSSLYHPIREDPYGVDTPGRIKQQIPISSCSLRGGRRRPYPQNLDGDAGRHTPDGRNGVPPAASGGKK